MRQLLAILFAMCFATSASASSYIMLLGAGTNGGFTGVGDYATANSLGLTNYWGFHCVTAAYSGNVADITDSSTGNTTGTRLQCDGAGNIVALVSASLCTFVTGNACSTLATTCATACNVRELYDQVGSSPAVEATNSIRPPLQTSDHGATNTLCGNATGADFPAAGRLCATNDGSTFLLPISTGFAIAAQPISFMIVANRTSTAASQVLSCNSASSITFGGRNAVANQWSSTAGTQINSSTANDNVWNVGEYTANGASTASWIIMNGATKITGSSGANVCNGTGAAILAGASGASKLVGFFGEAAVFTTSVDTSSAGGLYTIVQGYWGF